MILAAASEFDDRPGPIRDFLCTQQDGWLTGLRRTIGFAIEVGELPAETDTRQFAFELFGLILSTHHHSRLMRDPRYIDLAPAGLERLIAHPPRLAA